MTTKTLAVPTTPEADLVTELKAALAALADEHKKLEALDLSDPDEAGMTMAQMVRHLAALDKQRAERDARLAEIEAEASRIQSELAAAEQELVAREEYDKKLRALLTAARSAQDAIETAVAAMLKVRLAAREIAFDSYRDRHKHPPVSDVGEMRSEWPLIEINGNHVALRTETRHDFGNLIAQEQQNAKRAA
jgi:chromosome segregation ATPase